MHIENQMLEYIQSREFNSNHTTSIEIRPVKFDERELARCQRDGFHAIVLADGKFRTILNFILREAI